MTDDPRNRWDDGYNNTGIMSAHPAHVDNRTPSQNDALAILSLICAFVFPPLGLVFGYVSNHEAKVAGRRRSGLAIAGLILSWVWIALIFIIVIVAVAHTGTDPTQQYINCINSAVQNGTDPNLCPTPGS